MDVTERRDEGRFVLTRNGEVVAHADYTEREGIVTVPYVETRPDLRGHGLGDRLVAGMLDLLHADGRRIRPLCGFAAAHIRSRPERHELLA